MLLLAATCLLATVGGSAAYGPVSIDSLDPLTLSWNQVHWLVKNQIKEVEELKHEHDSIYNEIRGCFGLEKCLGEFSLLDAGPGSRLASLGLGAGQIRSELTRQREEVLQTQQRLEAEMRERERINRYQGQQRQQQPMGGGRQHSQQSSGSSHGGQTLYGYDLGGHGRSSSSSHRSSSSSHGSSSSSWTRHSGSRSSSSSSSSNSGGSPGQQTYERRYEYNYDQRYGEFQPPSSG